MRAIPCVAAIAATALAAPLFGASTATADPADPPRVCTVPADITGKHLITYGSTAAVPAAPIGDSMTLLRFPAPGALQYMVVGSGIWRDGTYTATSPEQGVMVIDAVQPTEAEPITYSLTLKCRTNDTGDYTYSAPGVPAASTDNVAVYRFTTVQH
ncbi:hypothetical protein ACFVUS_09450 [Nocardia sp. NPDC058058]|uniref:hypothetical protein n=1 Tax=Nocardia sp. NPDC058058 TaxID=3346317 RepID=UPI0036DD6E65